jgi:hypothetical protein
MRRRVKVRHSRSAAVPFVVTGVLAVAAVLNTGSQAALAKYNHLVTHDGPTRGRVRRGVLVFVLAGNPSSDLAIQIRPARCVCHRMSGQGKCTHRSSGRPH